MLFAAATLSMLLPSIPFAAQYVQAAAPVPSATTTFYLHDDGSGFGHPAKRFDWANTSDPYNPLNPNFISGQYQGIELNASGPYQSFRWIVWPAAGGNMVLSGSVSVTLYLTPSNSSAASGLSFKVQLQNGTSVSSSTVSVIAQNTTPAISLVPDQRVIVSLPIPSAYSLQKGSLLILNVTRTDSNSNTSVYVGFDYNSTPSSFSADLSPRLSDLAVTMPSAGSVNDRTQFTFGANVTDFLGSTDIAGAAVTIINASGVVYSSLAAMNRTGSTEYSGTFTYSQILPAGGYSINITAYTVSNLTGYDSQRYFESGFSILPSLGNFSITAPGSVSAGSAFGVSIVAFNDLGNIMTDYNGTASVSFLQGNGSPVPAGDYSNGTAHFISGKAEFNESVILAGNFTLSAANGSASGSSGLLHVNAGPVSNVTVTPGVVSLIAGEQQVFSASGLDAFGNKNVTWTPVWSVAGSNGTITAGGTFTAEINGTAVVTAVDSYTGASGHAEISISPSSLFRLAVVPPNTTLLAGQTYFFTARGYDAYDNPVQPVGVVWETNAGTLFQNGTEVMLVATKSTMDGGWVEAFSGGLTAISRFNVTASAYSPQMTAQIPLQTWPSGTTWSVNLTVYFTDSNDPTDSGLIWFLTGGSGLVTSYGSGTQGDTNVILMPYGDAYGYANLTLTVGNSLGYTVTETFGIHILPRPVWFFSLPGYMTVPASSIYSLNFTYFIDSAPYSPASLSLTTSSPYVYASGLQLSYYFPLSTVSQSIPVVITATAPDNVSSSIVQVISVSTSSPPILNTASAPPSSLSIDRGENFTFEYPLSTYFITSSLLSFSVLSSGASAYITQGNILHIYAQPGNFGHNGTVLVMARTSYGEYAFLRIGLKIITPVSPPDVVALPSIFVHFSSGNAPNYSFPLLNYVTDSYVPLNQITVITGSAYISFSSGNFSLLFSMPANASGQGSYTSPYWFNSTIVFVGGTLQNLDADSATVPLSVHVSSVPPPEPAGGRKIPGYITVPENTVYTALNLSGFIASPPGEVVTFSAHAPPEISVEVSQNGQVTVTPRSYFTGNVRIEFFANASSGFLEFGILAMVYPVYSPPVIQLPSAFTVNSTSTVLNLSAYIANPTDEPLTISAVGNGVTVVGEQMLVTMPAGASKETVTLIFTTPFGPALSRQITLTLVSRFPSVYAILFYSLLAIMLAMGALLTYQRLIPKPFNLYSVLLIHNDGRLIAHTHRKDYSGVDRDILVGMFTAIQDFISTSFPEMGGEKQTLNRIELGRFSIYVNRGLNSFILAIYSGQPPRNWTERVGSILSGIEGKYNLSTWDGKTENLQGLSDMLRDLFPGPYAEGPGATVKDGD